MLLFYGDNVMEAYRSGHNEPDSKSCVLLIKLNNYTWRCIEVVITGRTRNALALTGSWVRIPPSPPNSANQNTVKLYFTKKVVAVVVRFAK